jgi:hypothetical protein
MLGLLGLRIFEAAGADIGDLGEEHGHCVLRVCGKGTKVVLVPLPPAVGRAIDRAVAGRSAGPILLSSRGARMDHHAASGCATWPTAQACEAIWMETSAEAASNAEVSRLGLGSLCGLHQAGHDDRVQVTQRPVHQAAQDGPVPRCAPADEGAVG